MDIFKGLSSEARGILMHEKEYRNLQPGTLLFKEADPALGLFTVISGEVEIYREVDGRHITLAKLGPNEVFGEIGLIKEGRFRTASARTTQTTVLFELPGSPIDRLTKYVGAEQGAILMQNLICLLAKRLHALELRHMALPEVKDHPDYLFQPEKWLAVIEASLPTGFLKKFMLQTTYAPGKVLCRQGDEPDGFYFVHYGTFAVLRKEGADESTVATIHGPTIAGELGFFAGERRSATLKATEQALVTHFTANEFKKLRAESAEKAFKVLGAAAQMTAYLILEREAGR